VRRVDSTGSGLLIAVFCEKGGIEPSSSITIENFSAS
jgi:hypothetical protein